MKPQVSRRAFLAALGVSGSFLAPFTVCPCVYMSMSSRLPGSRLLRMPSMPAVSSAACSRYGFAAPSARRNSKRPASGMRIMCVRLLPAYVIVFGDQVAPESVRGALMRL